MKTSVININLFCLIEKENDYQQKGTTSRHMEIKMAKTKDKERLLKATRKDEATNHKVENTHKAIN